MQWHQLDYKMSMQYSVVISVFSSSRHCLGACVCCWWIDVVQRGVSVCWFECVCVADLDCERSQLMTWACPARPCAVIWLASVPVDRHQWSTLSMPCGNCSPAGLCWPSSGWATALWPLLSNTDNLQHWAYLFLVYITQYIAVMSSFGHESATNRFIPGTGFPQLMEGSKRWYLNADSDPSASDKNFANFIAVTLKFTARVWPQKKQWAHWVGSRWALPRGSS